MKSRFFSLVPAFLLSSFSFFAAGCASEQLAPEESAASDIVDVPHTDVERQSIGNCWLYAHASWVESMHLSATGEAFDVSQSYWTYWHWFDQISTGLASEISTGGTYRTANGIVRKYGLVAEKDFVFSDTQSEMSSRQKQALDALNASLASGVLKDPVARRDRRTLRAEMDRAWGLSAAQSAMLDRVFGADVSRTFSSGGARNAGTPILRAEELEVAYTTRFGGAPVTKTLADAMNEWRELYYARNDRAFLQRVQRALHDAQPVIITWFVDFNAMESRPGPMRGSFNLETLRELGPGSQGGHMTVLEDYQATLVDGTVLEAGVTLDPRDPSDKALLDRALAPSTRIEFLRVKNSWGTARPDRASAPGMPGYHDLYLDYLNGPVQRCAQVGGTTDTTNCPWTTVPLQNVVLPPGY